MLLVGSNVGLGKSILMVAPLSVLMLLRFAVAVAALSPCYRPARLGRLRRAEWWNLFLQAFFGTFLFTLLMLGGTARTSALAAGVICSAIPAVVALLSWLWLGERPDRRALLAIGLTIGGVVLINLARQPVADGNASASAQPHALLGNLMVLGAVVCESIYVVLSRRLAQTVEPLTVCAVAHLFGFVLALPVCIAGALRFDWHALTLSTWTMIVWYALSASVFSFWLWMRGISHVPGARAGAFTAMLPVAASVYGIAFLGEKPGIAHGLAFVAVLAGVLVASLAPRQRTAG
ncbi:Threonine/homoserine efflux transporter RhtA [Chitinasiproducens palmae]|uniref:Threonine/homoserine efflux transporter RhtA n=2 Tax=Chitinasiproducens palmae TaxID=1770053 RepID=A0A1H2PQG4_9BURK|nr:Threonine/homoserine efflux transporter RhtA [Chitinasiproducens palmae]